jgi:hypothetical protein
MTWGFAYDYLGYVLAPQRLAAMHHIIITLAALFLASEAVLNSSEMKLTSPLDYQVVQRTSAKTGMIQIQGEIVGADSDAARVEVRLVSREPTREQIIDSRGGDHHYDVLDAQSRMWQHEQTGRAGWTVE